MSEKVRQLRPGTIVMSQNELPCSPGRLRLAHLLYGEFLVEQDLLTKSIGDDLIRSYYQINSLFVEDPDAVNEKYRATIEALESGALLKDRVISHITEQTVKDEIEYNNFLAECQWRYKSGQSADREIE